MPLRRMKRTVIHPTRVHGRMPPGSEASLLAEAQQAGKAAVAPKMGALPAKNAISEGATYAVALNRVVTYRGHVLRPGSRAVHVQGSLLLDDAIRGAVSGVAKLT